MLQLVRARQTSDTAARRCRDQQPRGRLLANLEVGRLPSGHLVRGPEQQPSVDGQSLADQRLVVGFIGGIE